MYIEDVSVHLSDTAAARVGNLGPTFASDRDPLVSASGSGVPPTLSGQRVEVLPTGWVRVHVSRDGRARSDGMGDAWDEADVWLAPGEVVALARLWNAAEGPPGGRAGWEASWGTRRGEGT